VERLEQSARWVVPPNEPNFPAGEAGRYRPQRLNATGMTPSRPDQTRSYMKTPTASGWLSTPRGAVQGWPPLARPTNEPV